MRKNQGILLKQHLFKKMRDFYVYFFFLNQVEHTNDALSKLQLFLL